MLRRARQTWYRRRFTTPQRYLDHLQHPLTLASSQAPTPVSISTYSDRFIPARQTSALSIRGQVHRVVGDSTLPKLSYIKCWSCVTCIKIRKKVQRIASLVMPLWKCFVWKEPPVILPLEVARILAHHMFAAFIFSNGEYCRTDTISSPITCRLLHTVWLPLCMMFLLWLWG
ncbi:hypothetical protein E2C01_053197 [Portunus trituberculatus]|uniref:Uncharacterized protein n=1 Tax=Portunus trituberculatus TaxID=210409 RepID=A0A5B7GGF5_PORTR|nr:hypothetical protein [Portunus trituberculatus]